MAHELFVDTSGFFALLVAQDPKHQAADRVLRRAKIARRGLITTDYVLDETATLLKARGESRLAPLLFQAVFQSAAIRVQWMDLERFEVVQSFYLKHDDKAWSFTDCFSFCTMKELHLADSLPND